MLNVAGSFLLLLFVFRRVFSGNRHADGPGIVLPMQALRFFEDVTTGAHRRDVPWREKAPRLFWRGDSTGGEPGMSRQRYRYVHALRAKGHDVAFCTFLLRAR